MLTVIYEAHSGWRYIVLLLLALTIVKSLIGLLGKGRWGSLDEWLNRLTPISIDIQFLLGLVLWILEQRWNGVDMVASWEHPVTMLIGTALAHVTSTRVKKAPTDAAKFQTATVGYIIAGIVIALGVARITRVM
jgi:hypothetical protein